MIGIGATLMFWGVSLLLIATATLMVCLPLLRGSNSDPAQQQDRTRLEAYRERLRELETEHAQAVLTRDELESATRELTARLALARAQAVSSTPASTGSRPRLASTLALLIPLTAFAGYLVVGNPNGMIQQALAEAAEGHRLEDIEALIQTQTEHLAEHPDDGLAWASLAITYAGLDRWDEAEPAFARAYELLPQEAFIVSAYAEALAVNAGRDLSGRPIALVREALLISAQDEKALELAAVHAFQQEEYGKAAYYFRQRLRQLPPDSPYAADIQAAMREAKRRSEEAAFGAPHDSAPPIEPAGGETTTSINPGVESASELIHPVPAEAATLLTP